ncbi:MAG TPA: hypothetical protein VFQ44_09575 [Streptosporangiaceae bacterium]|nr:hypothetical protein [Streptosporangiaceae bacterium]
MGVQAAHAGDVMAQSPLGEDLGDAVLGHPGFVAVPKAMRRQSFLDREPAGERSAVRDGANAASGRRLVAGVGGGGGPGGDGGAGPGGGIGDDQAGGAAGRGFVTSVAGGTEDPAGEVAAPVVPAVRAQKKILAAASVRRDAAAVARGGVLGLRGEQAGEESGQVDREAGFPVGAAVGIVFGREPVEGPVDFAELPFDMDLAAVQVRAFQADALSPSQPGVAEGHDQREVVVAARKQGRALGDQ